MGVLCSRCLFQRFSPQNAALQRPQSILLQNTTLRISRRGFSTAQRHNQARAFPPLLIFALLFGGTVYYLTAPSNKDKTLNETTFVPYTITSREAVSPTSFTLTIAPHHPNASPSYLVPSSSSSSSWRHPLWSVEFKQPEVQISRHYTPLPPLRDGEGADGQLRFYIRAVGDGEMSNYLSRLGVGQAVWLRGPHVGFDLMGRLGRKKEVVFLAGGTGIAPGLQAVKAVLDGTDDARVSLFWAIRKREELQSVKPPAKSLLDFLAKKRPVDVDAHIESPSPVARQLKQMKAQYGERLSIKVGIDDEQTQFQTSDIQAALASGPSSLPSQNAPGCRVHSQALHEKTSEFEDQTASCECPDHARSGKNLFVVSGPDGFISHFAGPKLWLGGHHTQGPVGGIVANVQRQYPRSAQEWLVLKL